MKKTLLVVPALAVLLTGCTLTGNNTMMEASPTPAAMEESMPASSPSTMMQGETGMNANAEDGVMVGGAMMVRSKDIVDNAVMSKDHTTVVAAVKAAGLVETLKGTGPFTVFAPTNAAFEKLPAGTVESLLKPEKKADLTKILTYHVVPGSYTSASLKDGMTLKTVQGGMLTIKKQNDAWWVMDDQGNTAKITIADVISSNGVTFVVDSVLMP